MQWIMVWFSLGVYLFVKDLVSDWGLEYLLGVLVISLVTAIVTYPVPELAKKAELAKQKKRNELATDVIESTRGKDVTAAELRRRLPGPLFLYLRPFTFDGKRLIENPKARSVWRNFIPFYSSAVPSLVNLEQGFLHATSKFGVMVAIGNDVKFIGPGQVVTSDENWKVDFIRLSAASDCIFSVPSLHSSTLWELEWLAGEKEFAKVAMLFTEQHLDTKSPQYSLDNLMPTLAKLGWRFSTTPQPDCIFQFDANGEAKTEFLSKGFPAKSIHIALRSILP